MEGSKHGFFVTFFQVIWRANGDVKEFEQCSASFGLLNRKHHCRNCGKVVCQACSMEKLRLEHISKDEFVRVCGKCYMAKKQNLHKVVWKCYYST